MSESAAIILNCSVTLAALTSLSVLAAKSSVSHVWSLLYASIKSGADPAGEVSDDGRRIKLWDTEEKTANISDLIDHCNLHWVSKREHGLYHRIIWHLEVFASQWNLWVVQNAYQDQQGGVAVLLKLRGIGPGTVKARSPTRIRRRGGLFVRRVASLKVCKLHRQKVKVAGPKSKSV